MPLCCAANESENVAWVFRMVLSQLISLLISQLMQNHALFLFFLCKIQGLSAYFSL